MGELAFSHEFKCGASVFVTRADLDLSHACSSVLVNAFDNKIIEEICGGTDHRSCLGLQCTI